MPQPICRQLCIVVLVGHIQFAEYKKKSVLILSLKNAVLCNSPFVLYVKMWPLCLYIRFCTWRQNDDVMTSNHFAAFLNSKVILPSPCEISWRNFKSLQIYLTSLTLYWLSGFYPWQSRDRNVIIGIFFSSFYRQQSRNWNLSLSA